MQALRFELFLAPVSRPTLTQALAAWSWLPIHELQPIGVTLFADVFFVDRQNRIHFLDTGFGVLERIADSNEDFGRRLSADAQFARAILRVDLAIAVQSEGVMDASRGGKRGSAELGPEQILGFAVPLILGGQASSSNVVRTSAALYLGMHAQLTHAVAGVAVGTPVNLDFRGFPESEPPPAGASRRPLVRSPRDRAPMAL